MSTSNNSPDGAEASPDAAARCHNAGLKCLAEEQYKAAIFQFETALAHDQGNARIQLDLATAYKSDGQLDSAERLYHTMLSHDPHVAAEAATELGRLYFESQRYPDALIFQLQAVGMEETAARRFHLALGSRAMRMYDKAIEALQRSLELDPSVSRVHDHHVRTLCAAQSEASTIKAAFELWASALPDDPILAHTRSAWQGEQTVDRVSPQYVRTMFDGFADTFDRTLLGLDYQAWQVVANCAQQLLADDSRYARALDMGCGTGLSGMPLCAFTDQLVGVDLSAKMLEKARQRAIYDDLIEADLVAYFANNPAPFDLIVAADTLNYFGDLKRLTERIANTLTPGGRLVFSIEHCDRPLEAGYLLQPNGRFEHTREYIATTLADCGLTQVQSERAELRKESGEAVFGLIFSAQKPG